MGGAIHHTSTSCLIGLFVTSSATGSLDSVRGCREQDGASFQTAEDGRCVRELHCAQYRLMI